MYKNIVILIFSVIIIYFGVNLVNLERYHYANQSNLCIKQNIDYISNIEAYIERENCLEKAKPRISWLWDLYYSLF